jgi:hypothetical protein
MQQRGIIFDADDPKYHVPFKRKLNRGSSRKKCS